MAYAPNTSLHPVVMAHRWVVRLITGVSLTFRNGFSLHWNKCMNVLSFSNVQEKKRTLQDYLNLTVETLDQNYVTRAAVALHVASMKTSPHSYWNPSHSRFLFSGTFSPVTSGIPDWYIIPSLTVKHILCITVCNTVTIFLYTCLILNTLL